MVLFFVYIAQLFAEQNKHEGVNWSRTDLELT